MGVSAPSLIESSGVATVGPGRAYALPNNEPPRARGMYVLVKFYALLASGECARKIRSTYNLTVCAVPVTYI